MGLVHAIHEALGNDVIGVLVVPAAGIQIDEGLAGTMGGDDLPLFHDFAADGADLIAGIAVLRTGGCLGIP